MQRGHGADQEGRARGARRGAQDAFELPAPQVDVVEPSGAGDAAFAAGLVLGILEGWDLQQKARFASVLGGSACTALGCWAGVFTRNEAEAYLRGILCPPARCARRPEPRYPVTSKDPFIRLAWGSQTKV